MKQTDYTQKTPLNEYESKLFLKSYGIPVVSEIVALDEAEARREAESIGYPVVIKGLGKTLLHKSDRDLVRLKIQDGNGIQNPIRAITANAGDALEGFLVHPQVAGKRELVAGLFRDAHFGPVVMFGIGGVFTEAFSDITFRIAPINDNQAHEMIREIRSKRFLGAFRGERGVDLSQLVPILTSLSRIGSDHPEVCEIDINPLLVNADGRLLAVEALVVQGPSCPAPEMPIPVDPAWLGRFFHPRSIAFVGVSSHLGKWGHMLFTSTVSCGYAGEIHLVNSKGESIAGRKVYRSVEEVPADIDLCVVTVPPGKGLSLIPQFQRKNIKNMLLISSGFSETGKEGAALEKELLQQAREAGILIIGPN